MQLPVSKFYDEHHFGDSQIHAISYLSPYEHLVDIVKDNSFQILKGLDVSAHSTNIESATPLFSRTSKKTEKPGIDGFFFLNTDFSSHKSGVLLRTADCAPVNFSNHDGSIFGIAHIGWKGLIGGIISNIHGELEKVGQDVKDFAIWIGPMAGEGFEFGREDFKQQILPFMSKYNIHLNIIETNTKVTFNLRELVIKALISDGFKQKNIFYSDKNTLSEKENLPSWRKGDKRRITTLIYN